MIAKLGNGQSKRKVWENIPGHRSSICKVAGGGEGHDQGPGTRRRALRAEWKLRVLGEVGLETLSGAS